MPTPPTTADLERYAAELHRLQKQINETLEQLEEETFGTPDAPIEHEGDDRSADVEFEEADLDALESEGATAEQIRDALERLTDGTFGRCVDCDVWIPESRLATVPYAARCLPCQTKAEAASGV